MDVESSYAELADKLKRLAKKQKKNLDAKLLWYPQSLF